MSRSLLKRLKAMAPGIDWTTPIPTKIAASTLDGKPVVGFLCRICVADKGFRPSTDGGMLYLDEEACLKHIEAAHVGSKN